MGFVLGNKFFGRTLYPVHNSPAGYAIWYHDDSNFNCEESCQYIFKSESAGLQDVTIRSIAVRYVNIDIPVVSITISGVGGTRTATLQLGLPNPTGTGDPQQNFAYYGNQPPVAITDGKTYLAYFNFQELTTEDFTITVNIAPNSGAFQLVRLYVIGEGEEISR